MALAVRDELLSVGCDVGGSHSGSLLFRRRAQFFTYTDFKHLPNTIFLSYRRDDAEGQAGRLYRDLVAAFGAESVFMDVAAIQPGRDFRKVIHQSLDSCGVFLALIGKDWLNASDSAGLRRLESAGDFVRIETAAALKRDIPVIPVLVQGAQAPKEDQLPDELKDLAYRNAIELTHARWDSDFQLLVKALRPYVGGADVKAETAVIQPVDKGKGGKKWAWLAAAIVVVLGVVFATWEKEVTLHVKEKEAVETAHSSANAPPVYANAPVKKAAPRPPDISLAGEKRPLPDNPNRSTYTMWLKAPDAVTEDISHVHYDLVYDPNPLSLDGGSAPPFSAAYTGWGCYEKVVVTVSFKSEWQPFKKTFSLCDALKGGKSE